MADKLKWKHPAKTWPSKFYADDWSEEPVDMQIIDLLHDVRFLLIVLIVVSLL